MSETTEFLVRVANFEGPLALLLRLIEERELEVTEVSLAEVTDQYLAYLDRMEELNLEVASEFIVIAARLLELKARVLVPSPRDAAAEDAEAGEDGGGAEDLVQQLLAYRQFRDAAERFRAMAEAEGLRYTRIPEDLGELARSADLQGLTVNDLLQAFLGVLRDLEERGPQTVEVVPEPVSVTERMRELVWRVRRGGGSMLFDDVLAGARTRFEVIVTFLAMLELLRRRRLRAVQAEPFGPIELILLEADGEDP